MENNNEYELLFSIYNKIDRTKYHLCIEYDLQNVAKWVLFKKYDDWDVYLSEDNGPIMRSENNTIAELVEYLKKNNGFIDEEYKDKVTQLDSEILDRAKKYEKDFNTSYWGKKARQYRMIAQALLITITICEFAKGICTLNIATILMGVQVLTTTAIYTTSNRTIDRLQRRSFIYEAEADIYKDAFKQQWTERVKERNERVRR